MKIGVFDSGIGGKSVADAIQAAFPTHEIIFSEDKENVPYGTKSPNELHKLVAPILNRMVNEGCDIIVVACNTVTTNIISRIRRELSVPVIGIEPMIKPASRQTKSGIIAVCATEATLRSDRYQYLIREYAGHLTVIEPDCTTWAYMIEHDQTDDLYIQEQINEVCKRGADVIVLGCTHYHWIEQQLKQIADQYGATVIQPEEAVISRVRQVIGRLG
jgi:glutamate racemase